MRRRTSIYHLEFPNLPQFVLEDLVARCPVPLAGSGFLPKPVGGFVRVRVANDFEAVGVSETIRGGYAYSVSTGYGVHRREVATAAPVGCFCNVMEDPEGCLTCTCPDCGAVGRFGTSMEHGRTCL